MLRCGKPDTRLSDFSHAKRPDDFTGAWINRIEKSVYRPGGKIDSLTRRTRRANAVHQKPPNNVRLRQLLWIPAIAPVIGKAVVRRRPGHGDFRIHRHSVGSPFASSSPSGAANSAKSGKRVRRSVRSVAGTERTFACCSPKKRRARSYFEFKNRASAISRCQLSSYSGSCLQRKMSICSARPSYSIFCACLTSIV